MSHHHNKGKPWQTRTGWNKQQRQIWRNRIQVLLNEGIVLQNHMDRLESYAHQMERYGDGERLGPNE